jgi:serine acetyltransferase
MPLNSGLISSWGTTVGTVVGGDAKIGEGCIFFGNNTIGAARFQGSPVIGPHTVIGAGVRVLGPIQVGFLV